MPATKLEELEALIVASKNQEPSKTSGRKMQEEIYTAITKAIIPKLNEKHCPPLSVLIYAIREISNPTLATGLAADLLKLLAQVEHIRQLIVGNIQQALEEQNTLSKSEERVRLLDNKSARRLAKYIKNAPAQRSRFFTLTMFLRLLHIHSLWVSEESYAIARWMKEYFPMLHLDQTEALQSDGPWQTVLLRDCSEKEKEEIYGLGSYCKSFVKNAAEWEDERRKVWTDKKLPSDDFYKNTGEHSYLEEFEENFPCTVGVDETRKMLEEYLEKVEAMAEYVKTLFPDGQTKTTI